MNTHKDTFIITHISTITIGVGKNGHEYAKRIISMRHEAKPDNTPSHSVLFTRAGVRHTHKLEVGQTVELEYTVEVGLSKSQIPHTHLAPKSIKVIKQANTNGSANI